MFSIFVFFLFLDGETPGLNEEDLQASAATLKMIAQTLGLEMVLLRDKREVDGCVHEYLLRKKLEPLDFMEVR